MSEDEHSFEEIMIMVKDRDKEQDFQKIMDEYFIELKKFHPQTYISLMKEIYGLGEKINIENEKELNEYLSTMKHDDVPQLWSVDATTKVANDIDIDFDKWKYNKYTFNYVMNMMRSDYYSEFKKMFSSSPLMKQTILDSPSFYAHLAKAWLDDEDAPTNKAIKYIHLVNNMDEEDK